jgi:hypothetical protein
VSKNKKRRKSTKYQGVPTAGSYNATICVMESFPGC